MNNPQHEELRNIASAILEEESLIDASAILQRLYVLTEAVIIAQHEAKQNKAPQELPHTPVTPVMETINELITEIPETQEIDDLFSPVSEPVFIKKEEQSSSPTKEEIPKNLNDILGKGMQIGLNDRLAFVKNLFDGNAEDYQRVISQLQTFGSWEEAQSFIEQMIKPDYNNWEGKETFEARFLKCLENNF